MDLEKVRMFASYGVDSRDPQAELLFAGAVLLQALYAADLEEFELPPGLMELIQKYRAELAAANARAPQNRVREYMRKYRPDPTPEEVAEIEQLKSLVDPSLMAHPRVKLKSKYPSRLARELAER